MRRVWGGNRVLVVWRKNENVWNNPNQIKKEAAPKKPRPHKNNENGRKLGPIGHFYYNLILAVTIAFGGTKAPLGNFLLNFVCLCEYVDRGYRICSRLTKWLYTLHLFVVDNLPGQHFWVKVATYCQYSLCSSWKGVLKTDLKYILCLSVRLLVGLKSQ